MEKSDVVPRVAPEVSQRPRGWAERVCRAGLGESWPEDLLSEGGATNPCPPRPTPRSGSRQQAFCEQTQVSLWVPAGENPASLQIVQPSEAVDCHL